jgi:hypothetical protein
MAISAKVTNTMACPFLFVLAGIDLAPLELNSLPGRSRKIENSEIYPTSGSWPKHRDRGAEGINRSYFNDAAWVVAARRWPWISIA